MDEDRCSFDNSDLVNSVGTDDNLKVISDTQLTMVKANSKKKENVLHTELETLPSSTVLKTHDACISRHTSDYHIEKCLKRKKKEQSKREAPQTELLADLLVVLQLFESCTVYFAVKCVLLKKSKKVEADGENLSCTKHPAEVLT